jgi:methylmalonyl-CoA mutase
MSAILGGAESIYVAPFDECCGTPDEASRRLARNTQLILREEAFLARVADPAGGSHYVETLTDSIAASAWKLLQEIESAGGWRKASGLISRRLEQRSSERQEKV